MVLKNELLVRSSGRCALNVRRYHCQPMSKDQTVAEHTAHMMRIYWCIWGPMSPEVSTCILWHDGGEVEAGDIQFGAKRRHHGLKQMSDAIEKGAVDLVRDTEGADFTFEEPNEEDQVRIKVCDMLEGFEFAVNDFALGNQFASIVVHVYWEALDKEFVKLSLQDHRMVREYLSTPMIRTLVENNFPDLENFPFHR